MSKKSSKNLSPIVVNYRHGSHIFELDNNASLYLQIQTRYQNQDIMISCDQKFCRYGESLQMIKERLNPIQLEFYIHEFDDFYRSNLIYLKQQKEIQGFLFLNQQLELAIQTNRTIFNNEIQRLQYLLGEKSGNHQQNQIRRPIILSVEEMNQEQFQKYDHNISNNHLQIIIHEKQQEIQRLQEKSLLIIKNRQSQILRKQECLFCLSNLDKDDQIFKLSCNHLFHQECLKDFIEAELIQKKPILFCTCGEKIKKSTLLQFDQLYADKCFNELLINQISIIQKNFIIEKCVNKYCYFFCINNGNSIQSYCPLCLL